MMDCIGIQRNMQGNWREDREEGTSLFPASNSVKALRKCQKGFNLCEKSGKFLCDRMGICQEVEDLQERRVVYIWDASGYKNTII